MHRMKYGRPPNLVVSTIIILALIILAELALKRGGTRATTTTSCAHINGSPLAPGAAAGANATDPPISVFVGILSASKNYELRQAVRETWGSDERWSHVMFFTLRPKSEEAFSRLRKEIVQHGDIIVVSEVYEDYLNATYSTLAILRAAATVPHVTHLLKTDDDCYVRAGNLIPLLRTLPRTWMYGGNRYGDTDKVFRDPKHKRHVPYSNWKSDAILPFYFWGMGAVLTIDLVRHIVSGVPHIMMEPNNLLIIEDVATGVWLDYIAKEQGRPIYLARNLPFNDTHCKPGDSITHLGMTTFVNTPTKLVKTDKAVSAMRCVFKHGGSCCDDNSLAPL
jgi:hypothetical protein